MFYPSFQLWPSFIVKDQSQVARGVTINKTKQTEGSCLLGNNHHHHLTSNGDWWSKEMKHFLHQSIMDLMLLPGRMRCGLSITDSSHSPPEGDHLFCHWVGVGVRWWMNSALMRTRQRDPTPFTAAIRVDEINICTLHDSRHATQHNGDDFVKRILIEYVVNA